MKLYEFMLTIRSVVLDQKVQSSFLVELVPYLLLMSI